MNLQPPSVKMPLVSIITVVYNGKKYIEQCIKSVFSQTYQNIEYIIIDGVSTDGTLEIIKKYEQKITRLVSEKDTGIYNAMNKGLALAKGEIIALLNADDYYYPETIQRVVKHFNKTKTDVVYGNINKLRTIQDQTYFKKSTPNITLIEKTMPIFHPATFVKKQVYDKIGGFNEKYKLSADYDFIYKVYKANFKFNYLPKTLTAFRIGGASNTSCKSYEEGYQILKSYHSPYSKNMKKLIGKCKKKNFIRKIVNFFIILFSLKNWNEKRLIKKWNK